TLPTFEQAQPAPVALTNVTPAGSVSATRTLAASEGPALATVRDQATVPAAATVAGPVLAIDRSADAVTPVVTDEALFVRSGSGVVLATAAVLGGVAACAGALSVP